MVAAVPNRYQNSGVWTRPCSDPLPVRAWTRWEITMRPCRGTQEAITVVVTHHQGAMGSSMTQVYSPTACMSAVSMTNRQATRAKNNSSADAPKRSSHASLRGPRALPRNRIVICWRCSRAMGKQVEMMTGNSTRDKSTTPS